MSTFYLYRHNSESSRQPDDILVVFSAVDDFDDIAFELCVQQEFERNLAADQLIIIARASARISILQSFDKTNRSPKIDQLISRYSRTAIILSIFDENGGQVERLALYGELPAQELEYQHFQRKALTSIFLSRSGLTMSTGSYHFQIPSGRHSNRFIRASNMFSNGAETAFCAFCLLPFIQREARHIYVDTPTFFGLIGALNDHYRYLSPNRHVFPICFNSYEGIDSFTFSNTDDAVILISASSSGSMARKLVEHEAFIDYESIIHFTFLGDVRQVNSIVCDLSFDQLLNPEGLSSVVGDYIERNCPLCKAGSRAIRLEGERFEMPIPKPEPLLVGVADAPRRLGDTLERFAGREILKVGLGPARGDDPRQFEIDTKILFKSKKFLNRLDYILSRSLPVTAATVICVDERGSRLLAKRICSRFGKERLNIISRDELRTQERDESGRAVIIASAVVESGRSLLEVSRDLRSTFPNSPQIYVVGFMKSRSPEEQAALRRTLVQTLGPQPHEFAVVDQLVLPPSSGPNAWELERQFLTSVRSNRTIESLAIASAFFKMRLERLNRTSQGLTDELFLKSAADSVLRLQEGFQFWPAGLPRKKHSQADVFYTISSVFQSLRSNTEQPGARALHGGQFQHTVLAPGNFGRFNDGIIQAAILRAALPHEINYKEDLECSREMGRIARRVIESSRVPRGEAALEILMALLTKRLQLAEADLTSVLQPIVGAPQIVSELILIGQNLLFKAEEFDESERQISFDFQ